jgi:hypothetical protein
MQHKRKLTHKSCSKQRCEKSRSASDAVSMADRVMSIMRLYYAIVHPVARIQSLYSMSDAYGSALQLLLIAVLSTHEQSSPYASNCSLQLLTGRLAVHV